MFSPVAPEILPAPTAGGTQLTSTALVKAGTYANRSASGLGLAYKVNSPVDGLTISDHALTGCAGLLRAYGKGLNNLLIERVSMLLSKYAPGVSASILIANGPVSNVTIRNVDYEGAAPITNPGDVYGGITLAGKTANDHGSGFLFENIRMRNLWAEYAGYLNRDGFVIERGYTDGCARWCEARHVSDAGFDLKATRWRRDYFTAEDCRESFKTWTSTHDGALYSINPRVTHFVISPDPVDGTRTEHEVDFACLSSPDPKKSIATFANGPGTLVLREEDLSRLPPNQVIANCDSKSAGSKVYIGGNQVYGPVA